jgi:hypothetical protein
MYQKEEIRSLSVLNSTFVSFTDSLSSDALPGTFSIRKHVVFLEETIHG